MLSPRLDASEAILLYFMNARNPYQQLFSADFISNLVIFVSMNIEQLARVLLRQQRNAGNLLLQQNQLR